MAALTAARQGTLAVLVVGWKHGRPLARWTGDDEKSGRGRFSSHRVERSSIPSARTCFIDFLTTKFFNSRILFTLKGENIFRGNFQSSIPL